MEHAGGEAARPADEPPASRDGGSGGGLGGAGGGLGADGGAIDDGGIRGGTAGELWRAVRHDPVRLPEHLAVLAVHQESGPAAKAVGRLSGTVAEQRTAVVTHGIRLTLVEGCVVGGPLILLVPVAFCAGMLAQARMVLALAALAGADGDQDDRAAELLVLQGVYPTVQDARAALAATAAEDAVAAEAAGVAEAAAVAEAAGPAGPPPKASRVARFDMVRRMIYLLGLVAIGEDHRSRFRRILDWTGTALLVAFGLAFPVVWIPVMGRANVRGTTALAQRATAFYWPEEADRTGAGRPPQEVYARTATIAVLGQTLLALLLPVAAFLFVLFLGLDLVGGRLATAALVALAAGAAYAADRARRARGSRGPRERREPQEARGPEGRSKGGSAGGASGR
ncbi:MULTISPECIES: hypothetical protein [Kitasatospora]|uniref:Uncharacterized protein n=1 Tax=Kitasatospora setae (strain ATCC 33774 / DSM 43861 / JCM 3304 / KCC A-0304 / NBRC 14216 / KM-6054) TaxID=452652 RepID=E4N367_KITSK|nr:MULTISPECIES: hypothetical protein [Kitasatospora]BAJ32601.1 hypothetical protein KSE_68430 [Kitasatospora setae KM-6054]